jgi:hypothetical protein
MGYYFMEVSDYLKSPWRFWEKAPYYPWIESRMGPNANMETVKYRKCLVLLGNETPIPRPFMIMPPSL